jgi:hypothetical protein
VQEKGDWRRRYNQELHHIDWSLAIIRMIKVARLGWGGHLSRMGKNKIQRKISDSKEGQ